jgi:alpha-glucoside transport system permease protein
MLVIGLLVPVVRTAILAVTNDAGHFIGFSNFRWIWNTDEARKSFWNTMIWVAVAPVVATGVGLGYAVAIDKARGESLWRALVFLPTAISFVGAGVIWNLMYAQPLGNPGHERQLGLVNQVLSLVHLGPLNFPISTPSNTFLIIVVMIWIQAGFATVVLSAAIKGVPAELTEAAKIDGANAWQTFQRITVPAIRPTLTAVFVIVAIAVLKVFDIVRTMYQNQASADVLANLMYDEYATSSPGNNGANHSAALALLIFVLVVPFMVFQVVQMVKRRAS